MKRKISIISIFSVLIIFFSFFIIFEKEEILVFDNSIPVEEFRVAFIADQGYGPHSIAVLNLIKHEETDLVLHQGDFDYIDNPEKCDAQISSDLRNDFPYFA